LIGLDWRVPGFSTLSRRRKTLKVNLPWRGSQGPLHLLIDSTGIKVEGEGKWNARRHGGSKRRTWRRIHIGIDGESLDIRAAAFTTSDIGDARCCPDCPARSRPARRSPAVSPANADGCLRHPQISWRHRRPRRWRDHPARKNARPWKPGTAGAVARSEALRTSKRFGRTIRRRWSGHHRRNHVET